METDKDKEFYYLAFRGEVEGRKNDKEAFRKEVGELRQANAVLTAELLERTDRLEIAEELVQGVLTKSVDKYLNTVR